MTNLPINELENRVFDFTASSGEVAAYCIARSKSRQSNDLYPFAFGALLQRYESLLYEYNRVLRAKDGP